MMQHRYWVGHRPVVGHTCYMMHPLFFSIIIIYIKFLFKMINILTKSSVTRIFII